MVMASPPVSCQGVNQIPTFLLLVLIWIVLSLPTVESTKICHSPVCYHQLWKLLYQPKLIPDISHASRLPDAALVSNRVMFSVILIENNVNQQISNFDFNIPKVQFNVSNCKIYHYRNNFLNLSTLVELKWSAFILSTLIYSYGVIRFDQSVLEKDFWDGVELSVSFIGFKRILFIRDSVKIESKLVVLKFK